MMPTSRARRFAESERWVHPPNLLAIAAAGNLAFWGLLIWGLWRGAH